MFNSTCPLRTIVSTLAALLLNISVNSQTVTTSLFSYHINAVCQVTDVKPLGDYELPKDLSEGLFSSDYKFLFVEGLRAQHKVRHVRLYRSDLLDSTLSCILTMKDEVVSATITKLKGKRKVEESVPIPDGHLSDLGVFTRWDYHQEAY